MANPPNAEPPSAPLIPFYTSRAPTYDQSWHPSFTQTFHSHLPLQPGLKILDLACGTGLLTFLCAESVGSSGKVTGIDITPSMLKSAQRKKAEAGDKYANVDFYPGDVTKLSEIPELDGQTFDVITMASGLVLLQDARKAVEEWAEKYLAPEGIIALDVPHERNLISGMIFERTARALGLNVPYNRSWVTDSSSLPNLLESAGLKVEVSKTIDDQAGYGRHFHDQGEWDDHFVSKVVLGDRDGVFRDAETRRKARDVFKAEWGKVAVDGRVEEVDSVYFAVARKKTQASENLPPESTATQTPIFTGSCHCGSHTYTSHSAPQQLNLCHCHTCRRLSGSPALSFFRVRTSLFTLTSHAATLGSHTSAVATRTFCQGCGSPLTMLYPAKPDEMWVAAGSVDEGSFSGEWPTGEEIYVGERAGWDGGGKGKGGGDGDEADGAK